MNITLDQLQTGRAYQRGQTTYKPTGELVQPFVEKLEDYVDQWVISVEQPSDLAVDVRERGDTEEVEVYNLYSRVLLEGVLKDDYQINLNGNDLYKKTIGLLYALDIQNPVMKTYSGYLRQACTNLSVFNARHIQYKNFSAADFESIYETPDFYIDQIGVEKQEFEDSMNWLINKKYEGEALKQLLGELSVKCFAKNQLPNTAYSNAVKMLHSNRDAGNIRNIYYKQDGQYSAYDIYNALTASPSAKPDFKNRPDVVYKAYKLLN